jgi:hypothetical protein
MDSKHLFEKKGYFAFLFALMMVAVLALTACNQGMLPNTGGDTTGVPPQAALEAANQLAQNLGVEVGDIQIVRTEQVDWPDACLGLPQQDEACADVVTPGFRVQLEVNGQQYEFRTDDLGQIIRQAP